MKSWPTFLLKSKFQSFVYLFKLCSRVKQNVIVCNDGEVTVITLLPF